eukprot:CAMPEP_0206051336 /NCGR_PEP_ID=MMETSP1466-20131121/31257_1 /ASSEMBLY_ACC=CAM_ASM_001126 /TAXON_ID=44452 /ORGANISM="Pavlova gyrans, Strain CCMP608" /LENGTH=37 /DNA_ID= /DNA_START= /DNA_END= /DNA_ORIENTATION=
MALVMMAGEGPTGSTSSSEPDQYLRITGMSFGSLEFM